MRLPDFLLIGAAKSGTTTLYEYLTRHPQIHMGPIKEPGYFVETRKKTPKNKWQKLLNQPDTYTYIESDIHARGIEWYASLFAEVETGQVCGEATQIYTQWPNFKSAEMISQALPNAKLIYIMREPAKRAYSHYVELLKQKFYKNNNAKVDYTFEDEIKNTQHVINASNYMLQIEQYLPYYDRKQFLFLFMEDLIKNPSAVLSDVCNFIGVDNIDLIKNEPIHSNKADDFEHQIVKYKSEKIMDLLPHFIIGESSFLPGKYRNKIKDCIVNHVKNKYLPKPMLKETQIKLSEYFREPNNRLSEFLGCDLSKWNQ